jgi:hypothetical protein
MTTTAGVAAEAEQPYPLEDFFRRPSNSEPSRGMADQPGGEPGELVLLVLPCVPRKLISQQVILPAGYRFGQTLVDPGK